MGSARCNTCPRHCALEPGQVGRCHARGNVDGSVVALNYGKVTSLALDPVEKKPFSRWHPGSFLLSVGSFGCNLACPFCQNHEISQVGDTGVSWHEIGPEDLVSRALGLAPRGCIGIAYTYNEPLVGWEYVRDASILAHELGLFNAVVTNGAIEPAVFATLLEHIDAFNIDLKAFNDDFYHACGMDALEAVKANIAQAIASPTSHVEVTTLFVPGMSKAEDVLVAGAWLASLDKSVPYHISQYHPAFKTSEPPVPDSELKALIGQLEGMLDTVVAGNMF